jgi:hypothetical protein
VESAIAYDDLDLLFERANDSYRIRVIQSPSGETPEQSFSAPFPDVSLEDVVLSLQRPHGRTEYIGGPETERVKTFGGDLYEALFRDDLGLCLSHSLDATQERGHGLRIRLRLSDCPALMNVP